VEERRVSTPELALIASTRGMLGAGIALLLAGRLSAEQRKAVGLTLLLVGVVTTFPLMAAVFKSSRTESLVQGGAERKPGKRRRAIRA
jgi:hypothetical protein